MSTANKTHSKLGIAACLTALAVWVYFAAAVYLIFYTEGFTNKLTDLLIPESQSVTDLRRMGSAVVLMVVIFFIIPAGGHLIGILMSAIGLFRPSKKRLFSILGLFLNVLPMAVLLILFLIGNFMEPK